MVLDLYFVIVMTFFHSSGSDCGFNVIYIYIYKRKTISVRFCEASISKVSASVNMKFALIDCVVG